ncbi:hypothetical protein DM01DRAFT_1138334 [Hesseltinella vesiculosa]|uniref:Uncharacterized protein n=1 Tax=Hesseltinella vesiculosa TaxID=101127 RepID=A0A1X2G8Q4_9FUNG|nr:hypothetical protein DM01DRAFT_1138334 [Hesseltinella vesiculosa]
MSAIVNELKKDPFIYGGIVATSLLAALYRDRSLFTGKRPDFVIPYAKPLIGSTMKYLTWLPLLHDAITNAFRDTDRNT